MTQASHPATLSPPAEQSARPRSYWADAAFRLSHDRGSMISLAIIAIYLLVALLAPVLAPHDAIYSMLEIDYLPPAWVDKGVNGEAGRADYLLGTDANGRDVVSRLIYGTRTSLMIGLSAALVIALAGTLVGLLSGYAGGRVDNLIMRVVDVFLAFPSLLFYIMMVLMLGRTPLGRMASGVGVVVLALALFGWLGMARLVRGTVMVVKQQLFVEAAQAIGVPPLRILFRHVLPSCINIILVYMTFTLPKLIIAEATLGYLGVGIRPVGGEDLFFVTSWGGMFLDGRKAINIQPAILISVILAVGLISLAFTRLGDGLRNALDPNMRAAASDKDIRKKTPQVNRPATVSSISAIQTPVSRPSPIRFDPSAHPAYNTTMTASRSTFYLGRGFDPQTNQLTGVDTQFDPADLTTHGFITGMTGSGKTGLGVALLEEAALCGIPAIIIDPKGDLTNLLLHFSDLAPERFLPWVDADAARRENKLPEQLAAETAERWATGLREWGISPERIRGMDDAVSYAIFTPGSDAGLPVSLLSSFGAPELPWEGNRDVLREKIASTVTALLSLVGLQVVDPVRSREHILLSTIIENAWSQGEGLDLPELIHRVQSPPFEQLGVFSVDAFLPEKERNELALLLNSFLAAPAFHAWLEGQPLDMAALLRTPTGKPRHSIFYLAHLSETERRFFVTLLFSALESWMRAQGGSTSLRTLVYFDEVMGYLPPVSNPPTKPVMLRLLKQARAFGVGLVLTSQNPVDIDYQALANVGAWFIGKLQTDQDKQRLLDGLATAAGSFDRAYYDRLISSLGKRTFLLHNVHATPPGGSQSSVLDPGLFRTRWTMNYLAGPLTRAQIPALNRLAGASLADIPEREKTQPVRLRAASTDGEPASPRAGLRERFSASRPALPALVSEYFLPVTLAPAEAFRRAGPGQSADLRSAQLIYRPALLAQARIRYSSKKYNVDFEQPLATLVTAPARPSDLRWDDTLIAPRNPGLLGLDSLSPGQFAALFVPLDDGRKMTALQRDFVDWVASNHRARIRANDGLKVYAGPDSSSAAFREHCAEAARAGRADELARVDEKFNRLLDALEDRLAREERELDSDEDELGNRRIEELGTHVENFLSVFGKSRRRLSTSLTRHRLTQQARSDVRESKLTIKDLKTRIEALEAEWQAAVNEANERWARAATAWSEVVLAPLKKDVFVELFGVAWLPYYAIDTAEPPLELPAY